MVSRHHSNLHGLLEDCLDLFSGTVQHNMDLPGLFNLFEQFSGTAKK